MDISLVILAAGIGLRFGGGLKQLQKVDRYGHIIMDYSIYDAVKAGFNKIVFIIRKEMEAEFRAVIGDRIESQYGKQGIRICYVFQEMEDAPLGREKPWGTGHAVLACEGVVNENFAVINADDYYGKKAFKLLHDYLSNEKAENDYCLAGFILKNTLSKNGAVTRGLCLTDADDYLTEIKETRGIIIGKKGIEAEGKLLEADSYVSMNMWGFKPGVFKLLKEGFAKFKNSIPQGDLKAEFLIPVFVEGLLKEERIKVRLLETQDKWIGMTYKDDVPEVIAAIEELIEKGEYSSELM